MNWFVYNMLAGGGIPVAYHLGSKILSSRQKKLFFKPHEDNVVANITPNEEIKEALESLIKNEIEFESRTRGDFLDQHKLVESLLYRRFGVLKEDVYSAQTLRETKHAIILNYTNSWQNGFSKSLNPYIKTLASEIAVCADSLDCDVGINAVGTNFVVVKSFDDPLSFERMDKIKVERGLNFYQSLNHTYELAQGIGLPTVVLYLINIDSPLNDKPKKLSSLQFIPNDSSFIFYFVGKNQDSIRKWQNSLNLPFKSCCGFYHASTQEGVIEGFKDFMKQIKYDR